MRTALLSAALLVFSSPALSQENAAPGDWVLYVAYPGVTATDLPGGGRWVTLSRVAAASSESVTLSRTLVFETGDDSLEDEPRRSEHEETLAPPRAVTPFLSEAAKETFPDLEVTEETLHLEGRDLPCTKVTFTADELDGEARWTYWFSPEVRGGRGLVARTMRSASGRGIDERIIGFGREGKTEWGLALADVLAPLPLDPLRGAEAGDWAHYTAERRDLPMKVTIHATVAAVGSAVTLAREDRASLKETTFPARSSAKTYLGTPSLYEFFATESFTARSLAAIARPLLLTHVRVEDETVTVSGRDFACKRVSCKGNTLGDELSVTLWLSPEVKGGRGLVAMEIKQAGPRLTPFSIRQEIAGFGSARTLDWGRRP